MYSQQPTQHSYAKPTASTRSDSRCFVGNRAAWGTMELVKIGAGFIE